MHTPLPPLLAVVALTYFSLSLPLVLSSSHLDNSAAPPPRRLHRHDASDFPNNTYIDRSFFPSDFKFGTLTIAVKHEGYGSVNVSQKADSIWDVYALQNGTVLDGTLPGNAGDQYDRYEEDMELVEQMGMDAYRFSIAWTRIFPNGTGSHITPNAESIAHYNALIDLLLQKGIEPHVTLWAGDHPQALEEEYGGLLSTRFIDDFVIYANACFAAFGDRVKYWITLDEPNDYASLAYASTQSPPGRCSSNYLTYLLVNCTIGNSTTEPYLTGHNLLLAHSAVARLYKNKYQEEQKGFIGIALWFRWYEPIDNTNTSHVAAGQRAQDFYFGWFMDPLAFGEYPESMRSMLGPRLPRFTLVEATELCASWDFLGLNALSASYVIDNSNMYQDTDLGYFWDLRATLTGWGIPYTPDLRENLNDTDRVQYFHSYYATLSEAIRDGGDVRGVFAWSLIDGFELFMGLSNRIGLVYVDDNMERYPRLSAFWHQMVLTNNHTLAITTHSPHTSRSALK